MIAVMFTTVVVVVMVVETGGFGGVEFWVAGELSGGTLRGFGAVDGLVGGGGEGGCGFGVVGLVDERPVFEVSGLALAE
jgi:hypothetical protein